MIITKLGHACLLVEEGGLRILTDPGSYSGGQNELENIDAIIITHVHLDHIDPSSLRQIIKKNPEVAIITTPSVQMLLEKEGFQLNIHIVGDNETFSLRGLNISGYGTDHAFFHDTIPCIENTGYFVGERFFYPGDAFVVPPRPVEILALPVAGPWMKLPEAINYALQIKPKVCLPVHDAILKSPGSTHSIPPIVLDPAGIEFRILELEKRYEF